MMILKKRRKKLGNKDKMLFIKLFKRRDHYYDVVLARKNAKLTSRLCRFGYYELVINVRDKYSILSLDFERIGFFLSKGVELDSSFAKLLIN